MNLDLIIECRVVDTDTPEFKMITIGQGDSSYGRYVHFIIQTKTGSDPGSMVCSWNLLVNKENASCLLEEDLFDVFASMPIITIVCLVVFSEIS